jgi:hypothetical protein
MPRGVLKLRDELDAEAFEQEVKMLAGTRHTEIVILVALLAGLFGGYWWMQSRSHRVAAPASQSLAP